MFALGQVHIAFPATPDLSADPTTFDHYAESSYTATMTPSTSGTITLNPSYNTLRYTRTGREIHVQGILRVSSVSSPVGRVTIPLPVAAAAVNAAYSAVTVLVNAATAGFTGVPTGLVTPGGSVFDLYEFSAGALSQTFANRMQASTDVVISFTYTV